MHALCVSGAARAILGLFVCIVTLLLARPVEAGGPDSHLTATDFIARLMGFSEEEARLIAAADQSIDDNANTQPVINAPRITTPSPGPIAAEITNEILIKRVLRDRTLHSLTESPQASLEQLDRLRVAVEGSSGEQQLHYLGQYLHALQDAFFHQYLDKKLSLEGDSRNVLRPHNLWMGHYDPTKIGKTEPGHPAFGALVDSVAAHFDGAVRAYIATKATLAAVRRARDTGQPVHLPDGKRLAVYDEQGVGAEHLIETNGGDMVRLADAIAAAYKQGAGQPDPGRLEANLERAWHEIAPNTLHPTTTPYRPVLRLKGGDDDRGCDPRNCIDKVDYDKHPELLMDPIREPLRIGSDRNIRTAGVAAPGGISLSGAAAIGLPIEIDVDAIRYDEASHSIVLSGKSASEPEIFDAAIFLTTLRLACQGRDPYFSLDPADIAAYTRESALALKELQVLRTSVVDPEVKSGLDSAPAKSFGGGSVRGPVFKSVSLAQATRQQYEEILQKYPNLRPKLVFHPDWLRQTQVGKILYDADVVLKELGEGLNALRPDPAVPMVEKVSGYVSAGRTRTARGLLESLRWRSPAGADARQADDISPTGWRFWFDLAGAESPRAGAGPTRRPDRSQPAEAPLLKAADQIEADLRKQGLLGSDGASGDASAVELTDAKSVRDLSRVFPRMYVRRHEGGADIPGSDLDYDRLAADVNRRFPAYSAQYPELRRLLQVFRAYVAGHKIAEADPRACGGLELDEFPLLPAEMVAAPLPERHPFPLLALHEAGAKVMDNDGNGLTATQVWVSLSGGVTVSYQKVAKTQAANDTPEQKRIEALAPVQPPETLVWQTRDAASGTERVALALALDTANIADIIKLKPVTAAVYLAQLDAQLDQVIGKLDVVGLKSKVEGLERSNERLTLYVYALGALALIALAATAFLFVRTQKPAVQVVASPGGVATPSPAGGGPKVRPAPPKPPPGKPTDAWWE